MVQSCHFCAREAKVLFPLVRLRRRDVDLGRAPSGNWQGRDRVTDRKLFGSVSGLGVWEKRVEEGALSGIWVSLRHRRRESTKVTSGEWQ